MTVRNLDKIFRPKRIAVIGGSQQEEKLSGTIIRNLLAGGFEGQVLPVHPTRDVVGGLESFPSVAKLPESADLAVICSAAPTVPHVVRQCGEADIRGLVIVSAGFREIGAAGSALEQQIQREVARFGGMRVLGPKSLGVVVPHLKLNASFSATTTKTGRVAFVSQSGTLCNSTLDWAVEEEIGFSHFVSIGNMLEVGVADLIDYFATDPYTDSIVLFVESITEARSFMSAARAVTQEKPIVVYKAGRYAASADAAVCHTGALAGVDAVYEAAFQRAGIVRVSEIDDMFDCAQLLAKATRATGPKLAIVTNAGGVGVVATDCLISCQGELAKFSDETMAALNEVLPPYWSHANPIDLLGDASPERFARAIRTVIKDHGVHAVLVILTPQATTDPLATAEAVAQIAKGTTKPILAAWMGGRAVREGIRLLNQVGIPTYSTPKNAIHAFMHLVSYAHNRETRYETPHELPACLPAGRAERQQQLLPILDSPHSLLSEEQSKGLLQLYGIPTTRPQLAKSADAAVRIANQIGLPVVLKIVSRQITHKNEVGGVALNLTSDQAVRSAYQRIMENVSRQQPEADVEGVSVQTMVSEADGFELMLGSRKDPVFGAVILVGAGGIAAEVFQDIALGLPPLNERLARRMLESLRSWPILAGYRSRPAADLQQLVQTIIRFSHLVADCPQIAEMDVNPLLVSPRGVIALDARVQLDQEALHQPQRPFSHLAIRPYPEELVCRKRLKDGTQVVLRPIRPEDEPMWHAMLAGCSDESIRFRFRYLFKVMSHELAVRYCFIDYDRELAIVVEVEQQGDRKLIGVVHLVCDADHTNAEYAVLVADAWQGQGVGSLLTQYSLEIAAEWGLDEVIGETEPHNNRMIATFRRGGFQLDYAAAKGVVVARKKITSPQPATSTTAKP